ncbi:MAG: hypothetical protein QOE65_1808 [Solirubrobacteraceae bacterium]|jgi:hypothetical protein|nr:hypothetical protein [Solirubrobacteraceae bacterium]
MADQMLFIGWSDAARGREERALEVFNDGVGLYGRMQQDGRIEKFDVCLLSPNGSDLGGCFQLHGTGDQIAGVQNDTEFQRHMTEATLCVEGMRIINGYVNEGVAGQMDMYRQAIEKTPQTA